MKIKLKVKWKCKKCGQVVVSDRLEHHKMDWCKCRKSAVDAEKDYIRIIGDAELLKCHGKIKKEL